MMTSLMIVILFIMSVAALVACTPSGGQEIPAAGQSASTSDDAVQAVTGTAEALAPIGQIVDVTPMSAAELVAQGPGQTEGGAAAQGDDQAGGDAMDEPGGAEALPSAADWTTYTDPTLGFSVAYPANFVVQQADTACLSGLMPTPSMAVYFMAPAIVDSVMAGTDAPDLEVRIFESGPVESLTDWLVSVGVGADQTQTATQVGELAGLEVCGSTMVFPNCSTFVAANDRVYQLRVLNLEGKAMAQSFTAVP